MTLTEIDSRIHELEAALANPKEYPTEVYVRIVGYYRALNNWNQGKREEYNHRTPFAENSQKINAALGTAQGLLTQEVREKPFTGLAEKFALFVKKTCPNCPPMKARVAELSIPGTIYDAESPEGYDAAVKYEIYAAPTLILFDGKGQELTRISSALEWAKITPLL